jgi:hypothetical protein
MLNKKLDLACVVDFNSKPRIFEIETDVDDDPRAAYSKKEPYGEIAAAIMSYYLDIKL